MSRQILKFLLSASTLALGLAACVTPNPGPGRLPSSGDGSSWGPVVRLRDDSSQFPGKPGRPKPEGGWWATPIQATLLPDGKALITGWGRYDFSNCRIHRTRQNGESYLIDPNLLRGGFDRTLMISPISENPRPGTEDVLYCAGNLTLPDGRILFVGGARYKNLGDKPGEEEFGLNYSRLFDPSALAFTRIDQAPQGSPLKQVQMDWYEDGMMWYPTETRLPDGKVLVTGGFDRNCDDGTCANRDIEIFDPEALARNQNPWNTLVAHSQVTGSFYDPGIKDYTHTILLYQPIPADQGGGLARDVVLVGWPGKIVGLSLDLTTPTSNRLFVSASQRPGGAAAWDSSAALVGTGEILIVGGGADAKREAQRIDLFNPQTGQWRSKDTGITRHNPATTLLPDGTVLIVNGEPGDDAKGAIGDRHQAQIYDPYTDQLTTLNPWPDVNAADRGYHNISLLLKDASVLTGGGMVTLAQVGCERPDLRLFLPPYFLQGPRPIIDAALEQRTIRIGESFELPYSGPEPRQERGVVLMALGSETHSFDQGQRYVPLNFTRNAAGVLKVDGPANGTIAPVGEYLLFLIDDLGVPSEGRLVHLIK